MTEALRNKGLVAVQIWLPTKIKNKLQAEAKERYLSMSVLMREVLNERYKEPSYDK